MSYINYRGDAFLLTVRGIVVKNNKNSTYPLGNTVGLVLSTNPVSGDWKLLSSKKCKVSELFN